MTDQLQLVATARELRLTAEREWRRAMVNAHEAGHSFRRVATEAGVHWTVVEYHVKRYLLKERGDTKK